MAGRVNLWTKPAKRRPAHDRTPRAQIGGLTRPSTPIRMSRWSPLHHWTWAPRRRPRTELSRALRSSPVVSRRGNCAGNWAGPGGSSCRGGAAQAGAAEHPAATGRSPALRRPVVLAERRHRCGDSQPTERPGPRCEPARRAATGRLARRARAAAAAVAADPAYRGRSARRKQSGSWLRPPLVLTPSA